MTKTKKTGIGNKDKDISKNIVVFHHDDDDGFGGAWSAWKKFKNKAEYVSIDHGDKIPSLKNKEIYFIDICPSKEILDGLLQDNKKVVVVDHHLSAENIIKSLPDYSYGIDNSGAVLAWKYFHPKEKIPQLLKYIEDVDLWKFKLSRTWEIMTIVDLRNRDFKVWNKTASDLEDGAKRKKYIEDGGLILKYKNKLVENIVKNAEEVRIDGKKAFAVNSPILKSEIGNYLVNKKKAISIVWSSKEKEIKASLRSKNGLPDVSEIAKKIGGGGHRNASGIGIASQEKFPWKSKDEKSE